MEGNFLAYLHNLYNCVCGSAYTQIKCVGERVCARHTKSYMCMYKARKYFTINTVSMEIYANIVFM